MKKSLFVSLIVICLILFAACGNTGSSSSGGNGNNPDQPTTIEAGFNLNGFPEDGVNISPVLIPGTTANIAYIGGDAVNSSCIDPNVPACRQQVTAVGGVISTNITTHGPGDYGLWAMYDGQIRSWGWTVGGTQLRHIGTYCDTKALDDPTRRCFHFACFHVELTPGTGAPVVSENLSCTTQLYALEIAVTGSSNEDHRRDYPRMGDPLNGNTTHDGNIYFQSPTVAYSMTQSPWPHLVWQTNAYVHRIVEYGSQDRNWFSIYARDLGMGADPSDIRPIAGVYARVFALGGAAPLCNTELHTITNVGTLVNPFYVLWIHGIDTSSSCIIQGANTWDQVLPLN
jgi:hypothetical protein